MKPILKGEMFNKEWSASEKAAYCDGQQDLVEAGYKDMSHYRRRPPTETPLRHDLVVIRYLWKGKFCDSIGYFSSERVWVDCKHPEDDEYWRFDIQWSLVHYWAYAWVPAGEEK